MAAHLLAVFAWLQGARWLLAQYPRKPYPLWGFEAELALCVLCIGAWVVYPGWRCRATATGGTWGVLALAVITQLTTTLFGLLIWNLASPPLD